MNLETDREIRAQDSDDAENAGLSFRFTAVRD